ncbi:MAG: hypothetical protein OXR84_14810 [Magnetovibrio sp.]|nr:hypothetical protein [Magnetovibrio sp.]
MMFPTPTNLRRASTGLLAGVLAIFMALSTPPAGAGAAPDTAQTVNDNWTLMFGDPDATAEAAERLARRGNKDVIPTVVLALRYADSKAEPLIGLFKSLTGHTPEGWNEAMTWLERHPEIKPHESYRAIKLFLFARIDPKFLQFLGGERSNPEKMKIRFEEVTWGASRSTASRHWTTRN